MQSDLMIDTIPNDARVQRVTYTPPFSTICSVGKAPFHGTLEIEFAPHNRLLEFESFEQWLFALSNDHMTIEDLCRRAFDALCAALGDIPLRVIVRATTTVHAPVSASIQKGEL